MTIRKLRSTFFPATAAAALALSAAPALAGAPDVSTILGRSAVLPAAAATSADDAYTHAPGRNTAADIHGKARYQVDLELAKGARTGSEVHVSDLLGRSAAPTRQRAQWNLQFSAAGDDPES